MKKTIKNEHIVWAYAELSDGSGQVVICGLTETGIDYMKREHGQSLVITPPGTGFANVKQILVFMGESKAALKELLRKAGVAVSEVN